MFFGSTPPPPPPPPSALDSFLAVCDDCHLTADALILCLVLCGAFANPLWRSICFCVARFAVLPYVVDIKDGACPVAWYVWPAFFIACFWTPVLSWVNSVHRRQPISGAVFITGADSGMGHWTSSKLAAAGFDVFAGLFNPASQAALEAKVKAEGGAAALARLTCVPLDVTKDASVEAAAAAVRASGKPVVGVICCAGLGYTGPAEYFPIDLYKACWDINFLGYVRVVQAFLPLLREAASKPGARRGRVVCIGTGGGRYSPSPPMISAYMASKWSVEAFVHTLRFEMQLRKLKCAPRLSREGASASHALSRAHTPLASMLFAPVLTSTAPPPTAAPITPMPPLPDPNPTPPHSPTRPTRPTHPSMRAAATGSTRACSTPAPSSRRRSPRWAWAWPRRCGAAASPPPRRSTARC